jgi:hypothetical protein
VSEITGSIVPSEKFNDDSAALNDLHISAFVRIRGNCRPHSAITYIGQPIVDYDLNRDAGGDCSIGLVGSAREFFISRRLTSLAASEPPPPLAGGDHYREMAACANWRASLVHRASAASWSISQNVTTGAAIISTAGHPKQILARRLGRRPSSALAAVAACAALRQYTCHAGPFVRLE